MFATHNVFNQPNVLENYNLLSTDPALKKALNQFEASEFEKNISDFGKTVGASEFLENARLANTFPPLLKTHNPQGVRVDRVDFHPAYHKIFSQTVKHGIHSLPWEEQSHRGSHVARSALLYLVYQIESGHICPTTMTFGCVPTLKKQTHIWEQWGDKILSRTYDPNFLPIEQKKGALIGMAMTEKQGGSDVRANTTSAKKSPNSDGYLITGHKWFCSHPMADAFLMLAQTEEGPSCFFVPRWKPDGELNSILIQRLKDKLGDRSNASSEIELHEAYGVLVGSLGRGISTIIDMANHTRLDCAVAAAALMRQALIQALNYSSQRKTFGKTLNQHPMMQRLLADLVLESEAALLLSMRVAQSYDRSGSCEKEQSFKRIATAIAKYWLTKRSVSFVYEAMEVHGGSGYVEESILPRLYRQAPVNSIWEGSGNVICLDVLRSLQKEPQTLQAFVAELESNTGRDQFYDQSLLEVKDLLAQPSLLESRARQFVESLAILLQASLMMNYSTTEKADAFCKNRLEKVRSFGALVGDYNFSKWISESFKK